MWQEIDEADGNATLILLLEAEAVWAHLKRKPERSTPCSRGRCTLFRRMERGHRSPFVSNIDRQTLNVVQIFEDCFNAVFDGSSINPGRFYNRGAHAGQQCWAMARLPNVASGLRLPVPLGRFFLDETIMDPLGLAFAIS